VAGSMRGPAVSVDESAGQAMHHEHSPVALTNVSFGLNDVAPRVLVREREEAGQRRGEGFMVLTIHVDSDDALHRHCVDNVLCCFIHHHHCCPHPSFVFVATSPLAMWHLRRHRLCCSCCGVCSGGGGS
jgi:hypothetical protein